MSVESKVEPKVREITEENGGIELLSESLKELYANVSKLEIWKPYSMGGPDNNNYTLDPGRFKIMKSVGMFSDMNFPVRVVLKESPIHGKGVFATSKIPKGSLITFYPADILSYYPNKRPLRYDI